MAETAAPLVDEKPAKRDPRIERRLAEQAERDLARLAANGLPAKQAAAQASTAAPRPRGLVVLPMERRVIKYWGARATEFIPGAKTGSSSASTGSHTTAARTSRFFQTVWVKGGRIAYIQDYRYRSHALRRTRPTATREHRS